jgi:hypothetical protein
MILKLNYSTSFFLHCNFLPILFSIKINNINQKQHIMKNTILICALITASLGSFAQTDSMRTKQYNENKYGDRQNKNADRQHQHINNTDSNCAITMTNGKMMRLTDGKAVAMDSEFVMKNGTTVGLDGTVKTQDGKIVKIKEGDCLDRSGKIVAKDTQIKNTIRE